LKTHDLQQQYWNEFSRLKRDALYIAFYHASVERTERRLNILAAVMSLGALTTWAAKHDLGFVASVVILVSQLITAIRPYLPYRTQLKALAALGPDLEGLALVAETDWLKVARASIDDEEINKRTMALKRKALEAQQRSFRGGSLPEKTRLETRALKAAEDYMMNYVVQAEVNNYD
jgi:hypothetical protein